MLNEKQGPWKHDRWLCQIFDSARIFSSVNWIPCSANQLADFLAKHGAYQLETLYRIFYLSVINSSYALLFYLSICADLSLVLSLFWVNFVFFEKDNSTFFSICLCNLMR